MKLTTVSLCALGGIFPLILLPELPGSFVIVSLFALACLLSLFPHQRIQLAGLIVLFFLWGVMAAKQSLWAGNTLTAKMQDAIVEITSTDNMTTHVGRITHLQGQRLIPAVGVMLYDQYLPAAPCAGQRWAMRLKVRAVHGQLNEGRFDRQRYALAQHQPLSGRFLQASLIDRECSLRARYLASLRLTLADYPWQQVILGLGMGERLSVAKEVKAIMRDTGTAHLMAISGLHIAFTALLAAALLRGAQFLLPVSRIRWQHPLISGLLCATFYAWLTGLQPPALRTIIALAVWGALKLSGRQWSGWSVWCCCLAAIVIVDPVAILSQSLWLSAFAVAALLFWYQWFPCPGWPLPRAGRLLLQLIHLQLGITLLLLPLQIALFHGVSLTSFMANLFAVPLVTFVSVPLILAGMVAHITGPLVVESGLWFLADRSLAILFWGLEGLPHGWINVDVRWQWLTIAPWLLLIGWRFSAWRTAPGLCLALLVLLSWPLWRPQRSDAWQVHMLDVGQGLAMVIARNGKALLYDTGPAWPEGDSAQQTIIPWLRWHDLQPEGIILSHEHLDHRGGLRSLQSTWPTLWVRSPLGWRNHLPCQRGETWQWQGLRFSAHWPLKDDRRQGNNRSCVVKIDDGQHSILLTGDIESPAEQKMLSYYWRHLPATVIQVPHHGSNTSSSLALIQRVNGELALASASRYNAWRLPSWKVRQRYRRQGYQWRDTPHQGQITLDFSAQGWRVISLREQILPRWYHQWFGVPDDNG
ncbi:ComEC family protein [Citrobacter rodentium]|uniref:Competence-related protein n=2 Tax=Citrobacter rodentium TaxID=67825 RepID=D2TS49_CITRI|nr:ComEC family protein [Citrobacter rodentium]KIQ52391.1 competence protein ComEC [Citrobacter rodentium]QBY27627.1 ComEC family protein [Citrobacter rodentium]UHO30471.1 ComEC family protein [Citrobacter rodentium NBRC 105723 = DSM 16636]CBG87760.1 putative competence-related protein [Citrobacter rodentium ICC168]HAT8012267.1 ComEC family protein [Citrobacter rodentium NBRC 105723 = DSM 16636]